MVGCVQGLVFEDPLALDFLLELPGRVLVLFALPFVGLPLLALNRLVHRGLKRFGLVLVLQAHLAYYFNKVLF